MRLVATANAVVENYSGDVLPKLGLDYETFKSVRENIILMSMPAFGSTGPWAKFRAYGSTVEQASGLPHLNGDEHHPPAMQHVAYGDAVGGLNGAAALLTALRYQARTGEGQFVDLSQVEALFPLAIHGVLHYAVTGENPPRTGNRSPHHSPHGVYPCKGEEQWLLIQVFDEVQWQALRQLVGESLAGFTSLKDRLTRREELDRLLSAWTSSQEAEALMIRLQAAGVPAAAALRARQLLDDPHLSQRGFWQWLDRPVVGRQPNPSAPYCVDGRRIPVHTPAPTLGQHNAEVLGGIAGVDTETLEDLERRGIIGAKPRMPGTRPE